MEDCLHLGTFGRAPVAERWLRPCSRNRRNRSSWHRSDGTRIRCLPTAPGGPSIIAGPAARWRSRSAGPCTRVNARRHLGSTAAARCTGCRSLIRGRTRATRVRPAATLGLLPGKATPATGASLGTSGCDTISRCARNYRCRRLRALGIAVGWCRRARASGHAPRCRVCGKQIGRDHAEEALLRQDYARPRSRTLAHATRHREIGSRRLCRQRQGGQIINQPSPIEGPRVDPPDRVCRARGSGTGEWRRGQQRSLAQREAGRVAVNAPPLGSKRDPSRRPGHEGRVDPGCGRCQQHPRGLRRCAGGIQVLTAGPPTSHRRLAQVGLGIERERRVVLFVARAVDGAGTIQCLIDASCMATRSAKGLGRVGHAW